MAEPKEERRKFPRLDAELLVRYKILNAPQMQVDAATKNISGGGVCLVTHEQLQADTLLAMDIKFPHSIHPMVTVGRVVWSDQSRLGPSPAGHSRFDNGIEFIHITDIDRKGIVGHVKAEQEKTKAKGWKVGVVRNLAK